MVTVYIWMDLGWTLVFLYYLLLPSRRVTRVVVCVCVSTPGTRTAYRSLEIESSRRYIYIQHVDSYSYSYIMDSYLSTDAIYLSHPSPPL